MRKILCLLMPYVLLGCSDSQDSMMHTSLTEELPNEKTVAVGHKVSQDEALQISDAYRSQFASRAGVPEIASVEYVLSGTTRSQVLESDTVAYIFNYANQQGFTIVAADDRVNPILAYSTEGYYSNDNVIAKEAFVDRLGAYLEYKIQASDSERDETVWDGGESCGAVAPVVQGFMHQKAPFNKYIYAPACVDPLVGCVAVAGVTAMLYGANSMTYHGTKYNLKNIREGFVEAKQHDAVRKFITGGGVEPPYTYDQSVDLIAKLLKWCGLDVGMEYGDICSLSTVQQAYDLILECGFNVTSLSRYNDIEVATYVKQGFIVNVGGSGHSWIIDGCQYCLENDVIVHPALHCDWGWGGSANGYYQGEVFDTGDYGRYTPYNYYAVKIVGVSTINTGK